MCIVKNFPTISNREFIHGISLLQESFEKYLCQNQSVENEPALPNMGQRWEQMKINENLNDPELCIRTSYQPTASDSPSTKEDEVPEDDELAFPEIIDDDDSELLCVSGAEIKKKNIMYSIAFSLTYSVPVLYFWPVAGHPKGLTIDQLYENIIPRHYHRQVNGLGILGGISICNHPIRGHPVYFIHPCNTLEALCASVTSGPASSTQCVDYLLAWLGLVGTHVGLYIPLLLANKLLENLPTSEK